MSFISKEERQEQVRECAVYLDRVRPGWANRVDPNTLDFSCAFMCVVGQIWGCIYSTGHWPLIASRWPGAVTGGKDFWEPEILSRRTCPDFVPEHWTKPRTAPRVVR